MKQKYFSSFTQIETKLRTRKQRVSRQKWFNLFPSKIFIQIMYVNIVGDIKPFRHKWFWSVFWYFGSVLSGWKVFIGVLFSMREEGVYYLSSPLFGYKNVGSPCPENLYKNISNIANNRKIEKAPVKTYEKSYVLLCRLIDKYT